MREELGRAEPRHGEHPELSIIFDTETTGLTKPSFVSRDEQPFLIELGVLLVNRKGEIVDRFEEIFNVVLPKDPEWRGKFHWWNEEVLATKRFFREAVPELREKFVLGRELICHNAPFDISILKNELLRLDPACDFFPWPEDVFDTSHEFKHLFGYTPKLNQLHERICGGAFPEGRHRAIGDAMALYEILTKVGYWK